MKARLHVLHVVGARPNFMKVAPVLQGLKDHAMQTLVHTGQHYDANMSDVFFEQLGMTPPDVNLEVGSGSHARQTAEIMSRIEPVIVECKPDLVMVYGDVNSTVAATLVCAKLQVKIGHVEAGLRSFDRSMPEEINRLVTDQLADLLFTPSSDADENLLREGIKSSKIHLVGNVMIDTLVRMLSQARGRVPAGLPEKYALVTLHRPSNVDDVQWLSAAIDLLKEISAQLAVIFPIHPRTRQQLLTAGLTLGNNNGLRFIDPLPYLEFLALQTRASVVVTDSGGIQEETTYLGIPCITVRENTERPVTTTIGTNVLVGRDLGLLRSTVNTVLSEGIRERTIPPLWDGRAAERIASIVLS